MKRLAGAVLKRAAASRWHRCAFRVRGADGGYWGGSQSNSLLITQCTHPFVLSLSKDARRWYDKEMPFHTYILRCNDGSYYTGHTDNLEHRLAQHQSGTIPGYTAERLPVELVWCEEFLTREEALFSERRVKGWTRAKKEALIRGDWEEIKRLARNRQGG